jgi:hypothetical protein
VGEHLLCKQGVVGSIPSASTSALQGWGGAGLGRRAWMGGRAEAGWLCAFRHNRIGKDEFGHERAWEAEALLSPCVV